MYLIALLKYTHLKPSSEGLKDDDGVLLGVSYLQSIKVQNVCPTSNLSKNVCR